MKDKKNVRLDVLLVCSLVAGIALGAVFGADVAISDKGLSVLFYPTEDSGWLGAFASSFFGSASFVTASFLMGFGAVSQPLELLLVAFKGLGLGAVVRGIYACDNILARLVVFVPFAVMSCGVLILQSVESVEMSTRYLALSVTGENRIGMANEFKDYIFKFLIYLLSCAVMSALNCLAVQLFSDMGFI